MREKPRVVISGLGVVSPIGVGKDNFWRSLFEGRAGSKKITRFDATTYPTQVAGEVQDFDPLDFMSLKEARRMDRSSQMIVAAANMALEDAAMCLHGDRSRMGVFTGTAVGGQGWAFREYEVFREKGLKRINPFTAISTFPNASSALISGRFDLKGPSDTISSGCVSSTVAIGYAVDNLRLGRLDLAIVGGTEAPLDPGIFGAYCAARVMTSNNDEPCRVPRPFDSQRDGIVLSEGAAVLVLETLEHALRRNARVYAELAGWCHNADSFSMMMLNPDGAQVKSVMLGALAEAQIAVDQIDYVQAHASGTIADDKTEAYALRELLGNRADTVPVVSVKSMIGHAQGASGAIETAAAALALSNGVVPRSINCENLDPICGLRINREGTLKLSIRAMLVNTFGFGGKNASLVLRALT